jgi:trans-aconitate methyltransferase
MRPFPVVCEDQFTPQLDLIVVRALLHHLPERRGVARMVRWLKPGGWLFVQEPDFYPTWTVEPPSQNKLWEAFILRHSPVTAERKHD